MFQSDYSRGRLGGPALLLLGALVVTGASCREITGGEKTTPAPTLWSTPVQGKFAGTISVPETDGNRVYVTGTGVAAFDVGTGRSVWRTSPFTRTIPTHIAVRNGHVYAAETVAYAFDAESGRELWRFTPDSDASLSDSAADDLSFYFGTDSRTVYAVDIADGALRWSIDLGDNTWPYQSPVKGVASSGDTVYATIDRHYSQNGYYSAGVIVALDRTTGRELWRYQNGEGKDSRGIVGAATSSGRHLLISDHKQGAFLAVDRFTGKQIWKVDTERGFAGPQQAPVVVDGVAYASANDTYVYALDLATGKVLWRTRPAMGGSVYHAACGNAVFNNFQGLGIVDRHSGQLLGLMFHEEERITSGFAVHDDRIFFLTGKAAYALKCP